MERHLVLPGAEGHNVVVRRTFWGRTTVLLDGRPAEGSGGMFGSGTYSIPTSVGTVEELRLKGGLTRLTARWRDSDIPIEDPLPPLLAVLILGPPVVGGFLGGVIGAVIGLVVAVVNAGIARLPARLPLRVIAMVAAFLVGAGAFVVAGVAIAPIPKATVGSCVTGSKPGDPNTIDWTTTVDCTKEHDGEVVGVVEYTDGSSGYPGDARLTEFSESACRPPFRDYVGVAFDDSELDMFYFVPAEIGWLKGDRSVVCVAVGSGKRLTGSVRGSRR
jgi:hypothetical protein